MHNELLHIGPLTVYGYGFMIAMGVLAAWFVAEQRARKLKLACEHIFYLVVWCAIGGFTSAKILFWITNWREFLQNPRQIIGSDGFVVYGGIIGGILVGWLYCRIKKLKFLEYFDPLHWHRDLAGLDAFWQAVVMGKKLQGLWRLRLQIQILHPTMLL